MDTHWAEGTADLAVKRSDRYWTMKWPRERSDSRDGSGYRRRLARRAAEIVDRLMRQF
jgi:hypothetical protein